MSPVDKSHRESLQSYASILSQNLKTLTSHLSAHSALLSKIVVYPHSSFPGRTQQDLIFNLVRKKVEPEVEGWEEEGRALASRKGEAREDEELWGFAQDWITGRIVEAAKEGRRLNYTREEVEAGVEGVRTGLRRPPRVMEKEEDEESSEEEEEAEMDVDEGEEEVGAQVGKGDGVARNADAIARFMVTGAKDGGQPQPQGPPGMAFAMRR
jgi:mediator of RNA polymerase II transcription subunit 8